MLRVGAELAPLRSALEFTLCKVRAVLDEESLLGDGPIFESNRFQRASHEGATRSAEVSIYFEV